MLKSSNPILSRMDEVQSLEGAPMTVAGTVSKTFILLLIAMVSAAAVIYEAWTGQADKVTIVTGIALAVGLGTGLVASFVPKLTKYLSPVYAFAQGALLAGISLVLEVQFPGIAVQAIGSTFLVFAVMLVLYRTGAIKATAKLRATVMSALVTIMILYLIDLVGGFFHFNIPFISGNSQMGIVFSAIVIVVAALSLIMDFDFIEQGAQNMLPKDYEWYGAFGLLVTLVWLYVEILRLLSRLRND